MTPPSSFHSLFSGHAAAYAEFRPRYPVALFAELARRAPSRRVAWDAGTGNGQAAVALADWFERVIATDPSAEQLAHATAHARVDYRRGAETIEPTGHVADGSVALITVAQAAHWFDRPRFFGEAARLLQPGGLVALWCYSLLEVDTRFDALVRELHDVALAPDWPAPRALVMEGYRSIVLPFPEITGELPRFAIEQEMAFDGVVGYVATWSALQAQRKRTGRDPLATFGPRLLEAWGAPATRRRVRWPLHLRVGRKPR